MVILNSLLPVYLILGVGALLWRTGLVDASARQGLNRVAYWVGLPALLFYKVAEGPVFSVSALRYFTVLTAGMAVSALLAGGWARTRRMPPPQRGAFIQAAFRGNLAFIALPIILFVAEDLPEPERGALVTGVILAMTPVVILYNVLAVWVLAAAQAEARAGGWRRTLGLVMSNPLVLACLAGLGWAYSGWTLPRFAQATLQLLGQAAFPVALLGIGSQLADVRFDRHMMRPLEAVLIKNLLGPAAGLPIALWLGLHGLELKVALILLATPTAVASYILADQLGGDSRLSATAVVASTLVSFFTLAAILVL